ncbi:PepSY domain-containing protein [Bosea beijingensis]|jgi:hypothetical protein
MQKMLAMIALLVATPTAAALADDGCRNPAEPRQSLVAVSKLADEFGWTISRVRIGDGCYRLQVTDVNGNILRVRIHPVTLDVVGGTVKKWGVT